MTRRACLVIAVVLLALAAAPGCGPAGPAAAPAPAPASDLALVEITGGLAAVPVGSASPRWTHPGAVAAPDGSAVFAAEGERGGPDTRLTRLDPRSGAEVGTWRLKGPLTLDAVAPDGRWLALTVRSGATDTTALVVFTPGSGSGRRYELQGDVTAEAFTTEGFQVFTIRDHGDHYRVEMVDVATGMQSPSLGRDKTTPGGDMTGAGVAAVLTADRSVLATLYRNPHQAPGHPGHDGSYPAFVHLADLSTGLTYCADLMVPFGTGAAGDDVIVADGSTVSVADTRSGTVARIDANAMRGPVHEPVPVAVSVGGSVPRWPAGVTDTPGFVRVVARISD